MSTLVLIVVIGIGLVIWIFDSLASAAKSERRRVAWTAEQAKQQREQKKLEDKRRREEAIGIVRENAPELAALRKAVTDLRDFVAHANAYWRKFARPPDMSFRQVRLGSDP